MQCFEQRDIRVLEEAIEIAWGFLCSGGYFKATDFYAREVLAKKILITAQGNGLSDIPFLANEAIRYAKRFSLMSGRANPALAASEPMNQNEVAPLKIA